MIQLNLLPEVKTKYIKAQKSKRTVILIATAISGVALGLVFLIGTYVYAGQKIRLSVLDSDIKKNSATLKKNEGLNKVLTIQNQLNSLTSLHQEKPVVSRTFNYLSQITPNNVQLSNLNISYEEGTIQLTGTAKALEDVNKFVDTIKFTNFSIGGDDATTKAFSEVVLTSFGISGGNNTNTSFSISLKFDQEIFDTNNKAITLVVPKITSTRSQTEQPHALFNSTNGSNQ